ISVRIGSFRSALILPRIRSPSFSPGPRNPFAEERLALSYDALKIKGMSASAAMRATCSAIFLACASLSITHGPAIRNSGFASPRRNEPTAISRVLSMRSIEDSTKARRRAAPGGGWTGVRLALRLRTDVSAHDGLQGGAEASGCENETASCMAGGIPDTLDRAHI